MRVLGTAGHVDHGKSTLVKALTGIDPDRLKEEKERQMTIDLGFAWMILPSGEQVGIVDVPGHQDFIKNMLAGVGGIDAALLVVAADEGVMPQTREHLAILDLLQVPAGVIALTKIDLAESREWIELVQAEVQEVVQGSVLEGAPVVPVSAITGEGLDALRQVLDEVLARVSPRSDRGRPRLPIDRVFTIAGFGTVVTGTLIDGTLRVGQEVEILPRRLAARVRGLQTHKQKIEIAQPSSRVAVNLVGVSPEQIERGDVLTVPGWLEPTQLVDAQLHYLADVPHPLRHNQQVEFFSGAAETTAFVRLLGVHSLAPGESGWVQLRLARPIALVRGDRFIIRQASPSLTLGGGVIVDALPRRRHRRFHPEVLQRLEVLAHGTPADLILDLLDRCGPLPAREVIDQVAMPTATASQALVQLWQQGQVFCLQPENSADCDLEVLLTSNRYITSWGGWNALLTRIVAEVIRFHRDHPLRQGIPREMLKSRLRMETRLFNEALARALDQGALIEMNSLVRHPDHRVRFSPEQQRAIDKVLSQFRTHPYTTPSYKEVVALLGESVTQALIESGQLVRLSADVLILPETFAEMVAWVKRTITERGSVNVAMLRDAFHTSRKYALALLEYLDDQRVTRRVGDERVLR
ncbi:MAG: selenocysteine-specific translation elongation factor [Anaerolineae bacterium]|nr:selenocysteine-specific translation elongation factor [Anaerolineae bacterium]MDW8070530.1 selenocysteine-specific translation elongation factor [Anaerolineae bacterium]